MRSSSPAVSDQSSTGADRVLSVLAVFRDPREELGVTDIASALGMDKSVVHRILAALTRRQFVDRNDKTLKYRVVLRAWEVGRRFTVRSWFDQLAAPALSDLVQRIGGTGYVASLDGTEVVYLATVDGIGPFRVHVEVGSRTSAHRTALGRAILAQFSAEERRTILDQVDFSQPGGQEAPSRPRAEIEQEIAAAAERGYSINRGDSRVGVGAVGAAVIDPRGRPVGAISVGFPMMDQFERLWELLPVEVMRIAHDISERLS